MKPSAQLDYPRETLRGLIANVKLEQLSESTPCSEWDVRDLINHFVGGAGMFAAAFRGEELNLGADAPDLVGADPLGAFDGAIGSFTDAVDEPGAIDRMVVLPFGTLPGPAVLELLKFDLLVHCWDLATATGQPFDPPTETVEQSLATAQMMIQPALRGGPFGAEVTAGASATPMERLVAFTGRSAPTIS